MQVTRPCIRRIRYAVFSEERHTPTNSLTGWTSWSSPVATDQEHDKVHEVANVSIGGASLATQQPAHDAPPQLRSMTEAVLLESVRHFNRNSVEITPAFFVEFQSKLLAQRIGFRQAIRRLLRSQHLFPAFELGITPQHPSVPRPSEWFGC
jgi:hypothetical protein